MAAPRDSSPDSNSTAARTASVANPEDIATTLRLLAARAPVIELRVLETEKATVSGYFNDFSRAAKEAARWSGKGSGVYMTLNRPLPDLLARAANRMKVYARTTTHDNEINGRLNLLLDFDPRRASGISATDEEHKNALCAAWSCREWLTTVHGWPEPLVGDSGNGGHLVFALDLPVTPESDALVGKVLHAVETRFATGEVDVDISVGNPGRLTKVYGTLAAKGDSIDYRPHRLSKIIQAPDVLEPVSIALLEQVAAHAAEALLPAGASAQSTASFDLRSWLQDKGIKVARESAWQGGHRFIPEVCPWDPSHTNLSAFVAQFPNGAKAAGCLHRSCRDRKWADLKALYPPSRDGSSLAQNGTFLSASPEISSLAERKLFRTAAEIVRTAPPETRWVVEGFLAEASITELTGPAKRGGKSTLLLRAIRAAVFGGSFLGRPARKGPVVFLTEERNASLVEALKRAGLQDAEDLHIMEWGDSRHLKWNEIVEAAEQKAIEVGAVMLAIDTLPQFAGLKGNAENDSGAALEALEPVQLVAHRGLGVVVIRHDRKGGGDVGESGRGSSAFAGGVDTLLSIQRADSSQNPRIRLLRGISRFDGVPDEIAIELSEDGLDYRVLGDTRAVAKLSARAKILDILPFKEPGLDLEALLTRTPGLARSTAQIALKELCDEGLAQQLGRGVRGSKHTWILSANDDDP